jgi:hypothetical protein
MDTSEPLYDPVDIEDLWEALAAFEGKIPTILMSETPLPETLSAPIWKALQLVNKVREDLRMNYGCEDKYSIFPLIDGGWDTTFTAPSSIDTEDDSKC